MHIHCVGAGSPTIILDAGQGGWSSDWANIMPELSRHNQVCAFDRAGYGWSDAAEAGRSPRDAANDLDALLTAAEIEPPYLLVGFSHAGLAGRIFAAQHAAQMAGLVLVDPATEFDNELLGPELVRQQQSALGIFNGFSLLARLGVLRLIGPENMAGSAPFIAEEPANPDLYYAFVADPQWWETSTQEFASRLDEENLEQVRRLGRIPEIPLVIIGSDTLDTAGGAADAQALQAARHQVMQGLAEQSAQGEFIVAEGSTHNVLVDRPDVVVHVVETMVEESVK
jgi:pimeloyl-ACP methyl ester carboxylesterase